MITTPTVSGKPGQASTGLSCNLYPLIGSQHLDRSSGVPSSAFQDPQTLLPTVRTRGLLCAGRQHINRRGRPEPWNVSAIHKLV
jgi:hypothetical protein